MSDIMSEFGDLAFELGKVLLKVELSKRESARLIRSLGGNDKETIILQKIGKYWNQQRFSDRPDGLVVVTNHRLVFLSKVKTILTKIDFLSFPLEFLEDMEVTRVMLISPAIRFRVESTIHMFTFFSGAEEVLQAIEAAKKI